MPPSPGVLGPAGAPLSRLLLGALALSDPPVDRLVRLVASDVVARYLSISGRRTICIVADRGSGTDDGRVAARASALALAAWTADAVPTDFSFPEGAAYRQRMVETLARSGILSTRGLPFRSCPRCQTPRTPETIVYQSEKGPAYLVRFLLRDAIQPTSLLVWTDNPWKLLGTSAVLVSPDLTYVTAVYRRRGVVERILVAKSAIPRLEGWLPGCEIEVLEERSGASIAGTAYAHPLAVESPQVSRAEPPAGTVLATPEVGDSGTGIVGLVPRHGAADSQVAASLRVEGPVVITPAGVVKPEPRHKYSGLPLDSADAFILRDLQDSGLIFAELTVQRGVPHCGICGSGLVWLPGRAWCLEIARLPATVEREFARLLPDDALPPARDVVPWPLSETVESPVADAPTLVECEACERLQPKEFAGPCPCGSSSLHPVRRDLLPAFSEALSAWAEAQPAESAILFAADRRRVPAVLHHLISREAAGVRHGELRVFLLPTMATDGDAELMAEGGCADGLRAALVRATNRGHRPAHLSDRFLQESRRLRKLWQLTRLTLDTMRADSVAVDLGYPVAHITELPDEDRAFLSRFERVRNEVRARYEALDLEGALERLARFVEQDLATGYLPLARTRLDPLSSPTVRAATCQVLARVILLWVELFAPVAPFTSEAIAQAFRPDGPSLFERPMTPIADALVDSEREKEFDRWVDFAAALRSARRQVGLAADAIFPRVVLLVGDDELGAELQQVSTVLARVGRTGQIEIDSPSRAWAGRRIEARPVPAEIQRVYGARSGRILHLLERYPGRKAMEGIRNGNLQVVLDGQTVKILPGMIEFMESLPECVIPVPWRDGEILLIDPTESATGSLPSLSLDGLAIVRHVARRIRRAGPRPPPERILAAATGALAGELDHHASAIAAHLGAGRFQLVSDDVRFPLSERSTGRTRRGDRWAIWIPGFPVGAARAKHPRARPRGVRVRRPDGPPDHEVSGLEGTDLERYGAILELSDQLSAEVGRPVVGPAKMAAAWDAGFRSLDDFRSAPFDRIAALPGFGHYVAAEIVGGYGGSVPPHAPRLARPAPPPATRSPPAQPPVPPLPPSQSGGSLPTDLRPSLPASPVEAPAAETPRAAPIPTPTRTSPRIQPPRVQILPSSRKIPPAVLIPIGPPPVTAVPSAEPSPLSVPPVRPDAPPVTPAVPPMARRDPPPPSPFEPRPVPEAPAPPPKPSGVEIWKGPDAEAAWSTFLAITQGGVRGVCITREPPGARRVALGNRTVQVVWLSNIPLGPANPTARPGDLEGIEFG
ncbi:MAG TPA: class I tRNA ligase family protein, partial [Thermoplasmata archaeon]|nr:class I tRNA ligase family protein [Thermoplasmata archaeon]